MPRRTAIDAFASASLVALVFRALKAERPDLMLADVPAPDPMLSATLDAGLKRGMLADIFARAGAGPLLAIGQHLDLADETPTTRTLVRSREPSVLMEKWTRLERYHHASNRTRLALVGKGFACQRYAEAGMPSPAENALIAGLLAGLCARAGAKEVVLEIDGMSVRTSELDMSYERTIETGSAFTIRWEDWPDTLSDPVPSIGGLPPHARLQSLLSSDIGRGWRIGDAAPLLALSVRSLQRRLRDEGRSFAKVLRQTRINAAGELLSDEEIPLAEIGYCCGYADQAHFQRDFRRALNVTPAAFRRIAQGT